MWRYLSGFIAIAAAVWTWHYNSTHETQKVILFGLNFLFGDDPDVLGTRTWQALGSIGVLWLITDFARRPKPQAETPAES